jgi:hypothetical protein
VIVIESSWWPLVVIGYVGDTCAANLEQAVVIDEDCLALGDDLRVALVVAGEGEAATRAQRELLAWLKRFEQILGQRTRRLAWIVEDDEFRACTDAWLRLASRPLLNVPSASFRSVASAIRWLINSPGEQLAIFC